MFRVGILIVCIWVTPVSAQRTLSIEFDESTVQSEYTIETLRFYLSNIQFHSTEGGWYADPIKAHLIDIEDAKSWEIELPKELKKSKIDSISFLIGVDSTTNVAGILEGDLDPVKGMYWAWNSGYINFKVEGKKQTTNSMFEYHLGGYLPPYSTSRKVVLARDLKEKRIVLRLELTRFLDEVDMNELNEVMIPGPNAVLLSDQLMNCFSLD